MDPRFHGSFNSSNGFQSENQPMAQTVSTSFVDVEDNYHEDCEFSDGILRYIDQILMEEEMEDKTHMLHESLDFQAKERSFYEVLGQKYPHSPLQESALSDHNNERADNNYSYVNYHNSTTSSSQGSGYLIDVVDPNWRNTSTDYDAYRTNYIGSSNGLNRMDRFSDPPMSPLQIGDVYSESQVVDESKMLGINGVLNQDPKEGEIKVDNNEAKIKNSQFEARGKKNHHTEENDCGDEERSNKLRAIYTESNNVSIEEFDDVLLYTVGEREKKFKAFRSELQNAGIKKMQQSEQVKGSSGAKGSRRGRKPNTKIDVADLRSLLISCAQSVAADDHRTANESLKKIRQHSSPFGDGSQRLAHYFADGLEARLAGTGSQRYKDLVYRRASASDYLKAYYTCLASCPFFTVSTFVSNKLITSKSGRAMRVHIIDFGILYGFQWPTFIQRLAEQEGGPPKLRITGIEFPQPGFRPAERIEDTGRRLARYCETFNVPFEYNAIAQKWETVRVEDLKIEKGEFVAVNCLYRAENLPDGTGDETGVEESSRTVVLNLIRKINPDIFIHGIVNGGYGVPFYVTRFREAFFRFSAIYDMLETNIPRENPERMLMEQGVFGKEAMNVIACEGWERVERPETYKQWRVRHLRAGFMQLPFERKLMDSAIYKVRKFYHREFIIDEDNKWLLLGWKGRIIYAMSCWQPV